MPNLEALQRDYVVAVEAAGKAAATEAKRAVAHAQSEVQLATAQSVRRAADANVAAARERLTAAIEGNGRRYEPADDGDAAA